RTAHGTAAGRRGRARLHRAGAALAQQCRAVAVTGPPCRPTMIIFLKWILACLALILIAPFFVVRHYIRARNMQIWLLGYLRRRPRPKVAGPTHVMFCFVDHYEPMHGRPDLETQRARVDRWCRDYRTLADRHRDADGRRPQHGFFYPEEEYLEEHLAKLEQLCRDGYGEIEVHLHHDN